MTRISNVKVLLYHRKASGSVIFKQMLLQMGQARLKCARCCQFVENTRKLQKVQLKCWPTWSVELWRHANSLSGIKFRQAHFKGETPIILTEYITFKVKLREKLLFDINRSLHSKVTVKNVIRLSRFLMYHIFLFFKLQYFLCI